MSFIFHIPWIAVISFTTWMATDDGEIKKRMIKDTTNKQTLANTDADGRS